MEDNDPHTEQFKKLRGIRETLIDNDSEQKKLQSIREAKQQEAEQSNPYPGKLKGR